MFKPQNTSTTAATQPSNKPSELAKQVTAGLTPGSHNYQDYEKAKARLQLQNVDSDIYYRTIVAISNILKV